VQAYALRTDANNFRGYVVVNSADHRAFDEFYGKPSEGRWRPISMELIPDRKRQRELPVGDFPAIFTGMMPALSQRAVEVLRDLLEPVGELLPLACDQEPLWVFNCTRFADVLDEAASELSRFPSSGRIMNIRRHVWRPEVDQETCFRLPQLHRSVVYVTDVVVERMRSAGLLGYALRE